MSDDRELEEKVFQAWHARRAAKAKMAPEDVFDEWRKTRKIAGEIPTCAPHPNDVLTRAPERFDFDHLALAEKPTGAK